jgi:hypothetical protein
MLQNGEKKRDYNMIFRLKPESKANSVTIKYLGNLPLSEKINDELMECVVDSNDTAGMNSFDIGEINGYTIYGSFYRCHITESHLLISKKLPVMRLSVEYNKKIIYGKLLDVFIYANIKTGVKSEKQLINTPLECSYVKEISTDIGAQETNMEYFTTFKDIIRELRNKMTSKESLELYGELLTLREEERRKQLGDNDLYNIPKNTINFDELVENEELEEEVLSKIH